MPSLRWALIALVVLSAGAEATAISSVKNAFWQADFAWYDDGVTRSTALPGGVDLICTGTAHGDGSGGCGDSASATVISNDGVWTRTTVDRTGGLTLRNTGGRSLGGIFAFTARFGSFYPGGPGTGASVDDGGRETADYFTFVEGTGGFDLHGCNMEAGLGHGGHHECRPMPPTVQESVFTLGPSADWSELAADWHIYIEVTAQGEAGDPVPEPPALAMFLAGAAVTACRRKARSPFRQIRLPSWWKARSRPRP
jgi:hypothetical protein